MKNAELKGKFLEIVLNQEGDHVTLEFFPNNKRRAFVENMKRIAKGEVVAWVSETRMYCKNCRPNYLFTNINWSFKTNEKSR